MLRRRKRILKNEIKATVSNARTEMKLRRENKLWIVECGLFIYATPELRNAIKFIQIKKSTVLLNKE